MGFLIPMKAWLALAAVVAVAGAVWLYGNSQYRAGVTDTAARYLAADKKGIETVNETTKKTLADIGSDADPDSLLDSTNGWRD